MRTIKNKIILLIDYIYSSYRANVEKLYAQLKSLDFNDFYKLQITKMMHQFKYSCQPSALTHYSRSWTIYIHIIIDKNTSRIYRSQEKIGYSATGQKSLAYIRDKIWESCIQS